MQIISFLCHHCKSIHQLLFHLCLRNTYMQQELRKVKNCVIKVCQNCAIQIGNFKDIRRYCIYKFGSTFQDIEPKRWTTIDKEYGASIRFTKTDKVWSYSLPIRFSHHYGMHRLVCGFNVKSVVKPFERSDNVDEQGT